MEKNSPGKETAAIITTTDRIENVTDSERFILFCLFRETKQVELARTEMEH